MPDIWRFNQWYIHVIYIALDANSQNSRLQGYADGRGVQDWLDTLREKTEANVRVEQCDKDLFTELVEQELIRLSRFDGDERLPCNCEVNVHRKVIHQFRLMNLEP